MGTASLLQDKVGILAADQNDEKVRGHDMLLATFADLLSGYTSSRRVDLQEGMYDGGENRLILIVLIQGSTVITYCGFMEDVLTFFSSCPSHHAIPCETVAPLLRRDTVEGQVSQHYANHRKKIT